MAPCKYSAINLLCHVWAVHAILYKTFPHYVWHGRLQNFETQKRWAVTFFRSMINHFSSETLAKSQGSDQHILHIDVSCNKIDTNTSHSDRMVSSIHRLYRILGYIQHTAHTQQIYETLYTLYTLRKERRKIY